MATTFESLIVKASNHFNRKYKLKLISNVDYNECLFGDLYALSNNLIKEDYDHWVSHAITNQFLHLIQDKTENNKTVGFQFWRSIPTQSQNHSILFGGKLRYNSSIRGCGTNLISNVEIYKTLKTGNYAIYNDKNHTIYRVGIFNIFGYLSCIDSLDKNKYFIYPFNDNKQCQILITPILKDFCAENKFEIDNKTGLVNVKQKIPNDTILSLNKSFWQKPKIKEFININPEWKSGWDVLVAWELDQYNIDCMLTNGWKRYANKMGLT